MLNERITNRKDANRTRMRGRKPTTLRRCFQTDYTSSTGNSGNCVCMCVREKEKEKGKERKGDSISCGSGFGSNHLRLHTL